MSACRFCYLSHHTDDCHRVALATLQCSCGYKRVYQYRLGLGIDVSGKSCQSCGRLGKLRQVADCGLVVERDRSCAGWALEPVSPISLPGKTR